MTVTESAPALINAAVPAYAIDLKTAYASPRGAANVALSTPMRAYWWTIRAGERIPLFPRNALTTGDSRRGLIAGEFFPDETTTGVYDPAVLTTVTGTQFFDTPGETIENKHFKGRVSIRAANVSFRNCLFTGPPALPQDNAIVVATATSQSGLLLEDCTIAPERPGHITNCIEGHSMTLRRVNTYHGVDLCSVIAPAGFERADVTIEGSWLHDPAMFNTATQPDNVTHNDVIQWHGMKGLTVHGSRLEGWCAPGIGDIDKPPVGTWPNSLVSGNPWYPNRWAQGAGVMASPPRAMFDDFTFTSNWVNGSAVGLNLTRDDGTFPDCGTITGNYWGSDWRLGPDFAVLAKTHQTMTLSGNYRWNPVDPFDKSTPFNVRKAG